MEAISSRFTQDLHHGTFQKTVFFLLLFNDGGSATGDNYPYKCMIWKDEAEE
jgi:hypothetical protein